MTLGLAFVSGALLLGSVHGLVGALQCIATGLARADHADTDGNTPSGVDPHLVNQSASQFMGLVGSGMWQQGGEFIATDTGENIGKTQATTDGVSDALDVVIASGVAVLIIDPFKPVKVDHQHRSLAVVTLRATQRCVKRKFFFESPAVEDICQRVVSCLAPQKLLVPLTSRDIFDVGNEIEGLPLGVMGH